MPTRTRAAAVRRLLGNVRYEVLPTSRIEDLVATHLAARMISGRSELADVTERLREVGVTTIFVPAGDADPVGPYVGALDLLDDLAVIGNPFTQVATTPCVC